MNTVACAEEVIHGVFLVAGIAPAVLDTGQQKLSLELKITNPPRKVLPMILPFMTLGLLSILGLSCVVAPFLGSVR
ncbi:MAG: hypothetical protein WC076_09695 [Terrimicrobiaceae bacterium]|nr:hypothetical protein [Terrimicrobiaceae bacterium]